jgi:hypothetical protein
MPIKFLKDHVVQGVPVESFSTGQVVKDRSPESEMHFVRRGIAAFVDGEGNLTDHDGKAVSAEGENTTVVVNVSDNRDGEVGRAGEVLLDDGTPQRGSSGPGEVVTSSSVTEGESHKAAAKGKK